MGALLATFVVPALTQENPREITSQSAPITFKASAKEVLVRVVVRDAKGNAVANLTRYDFLVFDKSVAQKLTSFRAETSASSSAAAPAAGESGEPAALPGAIVPQHFIAYLFDDVHAETSDLMRARAAATKHLVATLNPADRAGIFTVSGQVTVDFTDDANKLRDALDRLRSRPLSHEGELQCPWMSFYMADLIINRDDQTALMTAARDLMNCESLPPEYLDQALREAKMKAWRLLAEGNTETRMALDVLKQVIQRISAAPGQRTLVLASPGFLVTQDYRLDVNAAIDRAVRANVIVSTLDVRGLWIDPGVEASRNQRPNITLRQYMRDSADAQSDVMVQLADGTGGTHHHNNNDLEQGFRRTAATPEFSYVLAFAPEKLKSDGAFHPLKVKLNRPGNYAIIARKGYFAPPKADNPAEVAKQVIEDAVFSREEVTGIPLDIRTEFFKTSGEQVRLAVLARVQVHNLAFKKAEGLNMNTVTVVSAIFDSNGRYVAGEEKLVELHMHDAFLDTVARTGIVVRSSFDVQPGGYLVRVVVRDTEGQMLSAKNGTVEIP